MCCNVTTPAAAAQTFKALSLLIFYSGKCQKSLDKAHTEKSEEKVRMAM